MAYTRAKEATKTNYLKINDTFSVCGTPDRFSIQINLNAGICKIHGCRLVDGNKGTFIGMPRWRSMDGEYHNCAQLLLEETRIDEIIKFVDENL